MAERIKLASVWEDGGHGLPLLQAPGDLKGGEYLGA